MAVEQHDAGGPPASAGATKHAREDLRLPEDPRGRKILDGRALGGVPEELSGRHSAEAGWVQRKLGPPAFAVWTALLNLRDARGVTRVTAPSLAPTLRPPLRPEQVAKALKRLYALRLVERAGSARYSDGGGRPCEIVTRRVLGAAGEWPDGAPCYLVPADAWARLQTAGRGGTRAGAGRRPNSPNSKRPAREESKGPAYGNQRGPHTENQSGPHTDPAPEIKGARTGESKGPAPAGNQSGPERLLTNSSFTPLGTSGEGAAAPPAGPAMGDDELDRFLAGEGRPAVGTPTRVWSLDEHRAAGLRIPPDPRTVLPEFKLPAVPELEPEWSVERCVEELRRVYRSCAESRAKKRLFGFPGQGEARPGWKHYETLALAAKLMRENGVRPIPWVGWGFDRWEDLGKGGAAPLGFVFGAPNFEHLAWYAREAPRYSAVAMRTIPERTELLQRHSLLCTRLRLTPPEQGQAVLDELLPPELYRRLLENVRARGNAEVALWERRISRGEWVWSRK